MNWLINNWIEVVGASLALLYLLLEVRQKWTMWIVGIFSSAFYVYIFFHAHLFANMGINVYYTLMSFYGLYCWKLAKRSDKESSLDFHSISSRLAVILSILSVLIFIVIYGILTLFPESEVPIPDALVAALSIVATWMTARKIVECWYPWIFVNFFAVGLYAYQGLYPTAVLFIIYGILSIFGLINWRKSILNK
jgi:nicotinamide mononucleotide transporter PnuC